MLMANLSDISEGSDAAKVFLIDYILQPTRHMSMAREGKES